MIWQSAFSIGWEQYFFFADVDSLFGGIPSFLEPKENAIESLLGKEGGSVALFPPSQCCTSSSYIERNFDFLGSNGGSGYSNISVGFPSNTIFPWSQIFADFKDLSQLDPRIIQSHQIFIRHVELLPAGQHNFCLHGIGPIVFSIIWVAIVGMDGQS